jgi:hypothetical protein
MQVIRWLCSFLDPPAELLRTSAELADEAPDVMSDTDSVARLGRVVTVTLIASTQTADPEGHGPGQVQGPRRRQSERTSLQTAKSPHGHPCGDFACPSAYGLSFEFLMVGSSRRITRILYALILVGHGTFGPYRSPRSARPCVRPTTLTGKPPPTSPDRAHSTSSHQE